MNRATLSVTVEVASAERSSRSGWLGPKDKERPMNMEALERALSKQSTVDRFWNKVDRSNGSESCWTWTAALGSTGYGAFAPHGTKTYKAHRIAWILQFGSIPNGMFVCHRCDNRRCCNPLHFFLGTNADNQRDSAMKGRRRGEKANNVKLTESIVAEIRSASGVQREIGARFGIAQTHVSRIKAGLRWGHSL